MKLDLASISFENVHRFFSAAISPRPICLVSTVGKNGVYNVAPFGIYGRLSTRPPIVYVGVGVKRKARLRKDTIINIEFAKDFVINAVEESMAEKTNQAGAEYPSDVSEFKEVGLTPVKSELVKSPRVGESPISMECKLKKVLKFGKFPDTQEIALGEVVMVHIKDELWVNGGIDLAKFKPLARLGGDLYCRIRDTFEMKIPTL